MCQHVRDRGPQVQMPCSPLDHLRCFGRPHTRYGCRRALARHHARHPRQLTRDCSPSGDLPAGRSSAKWMAGVRVGRGAGGRPPACAAPDYDLLPFACAISGPQLTLRHAADLPKGRGGERAARAPGGGALAAGHGERHGGQPREQPVADDGRRGAGAGEAAGEHLRVAIRPGTSCLLLDGAARCVERHTHTRIFWARRPGASWAAGNTDAF